MAQSQYDYTNIHLRDGDVNELDRVASEMFGDADGLPYRVVVRQLIADYDQRKTEDYEL